MSVLIFSIIETKRKKRLGASRGGLLHSCPRDLGGQPHDGGGCIEALVPGAGDTAGEGPRWRYLGPEGGHDYPFWPAMATEHSITIYGCSGGPISFRSLPDSQVPPSIRSLADTDVRVLWCGGYTRTSTLRVPAVDVSSAAATPVALHRGGPEEREWPPTHRDWTWQFLVQTGVGRIWLGRFLAAIRPRWSMRDQLRSEDVASSAERTQDEGS